MTRPARIILTGFSGTGKSRIAPLIAERLGWQADDTDEMVERSTGQAILDIFREQGEQRFRELESLALREACARDGVVVSTGGGMVLSADNRRFMAEAGFVVCLEARPETILQRLRDRSDVEPLDRPLLATADPLPRIRELKAGRQHLYALCDWAVHTDGLTVEHAAEEVLRVWEAMSATILAYPGRVDAMTAPHAAAPDTTLHAIPSGAAAMITTNSRDYPVFVEWDGLPDLGRRLREAGLTRQAYLISDETVYGRYGPQAEDAIRGADIPVDSYAVPPGEASKSLEVAGAIYDWLVEHHAERGHAVVALGGGMVTDLAGFVAATFARGLPLVHAPTSLLGMVDAAIGGKVAVNHPQAKNMIGCFYQPRLVLADIATLRTLPERDLRAGWAEVIKHALIAGDELLAFLEENAERILALDPELTTEAVRRSVAVKAGFVSADEREETGYRTLLNYGHTLAHALETATDYGQFLHGEAVAVGMTAAAAISRRLGLLSSDVEARQRRLIERFGLPATASGIDRERVRAAISLDKKVRGKAVQWVLLEGVGRPLLRDDVPLSVVEQALDQTLAGG